MNDIGKIRFYGNDERFDLKLGHEYSTYYGNATMLMDGVYERKLASSNLRNNSCDVKLAGYGGLELRVKELVLPEGVNFLQVYDNVRVECPVTLPSTLKWLRCDTDVSITNLGDFANKGDVQFDIYPPRFFGDIDLFGFG